jgi:membrane glycosyltransferase
LKRRAGYEVRVLPEEDLGWEENPTTLLEFLRRDQRWLQGTLQYVFFLALPGLRPVSRIQLVFAMLMFTGSPAWVGLWLLGIARIASAPTIGAVFDRAYGTALLATVLTMWFAPKIVTIIDVLSRPALRQGFGGPLRFAASVAAETIFWLMLAPIMWVCHTAFFLGLAFGRVIGWGAQARDDHSIAWATAFGRLWPQTVVGAACAITVARSHPAALPWVLILMAGGPLLAVPLCVVTSWPGVGRALRRLGIARLPEETNPPPALSRRASVVPAAAD